MRFDAAVASYTKTYELTYHDPQWMEKIAELRARQGRVEEASKALRTALIEGRPERAEIFFAVASRLEHWGMARSGEAVRGRGRAVAGPADLLRSGSAYVSVYTGLRQSALAFDRLLAAQTEAMAAFGPEAGESATGDALSARLDEMGELVARVFSPEEKTGVAAFLEQKKSALRATISSASSCRLPSAPACSISPFAGKPS